MQQFMQQSLLSPQQAADLQLHIGLMLYDRRKKDHGELPGLAELATRLGVTPLNRPHTTEWQVGLQTTTPFPVPYLLLVGSGYSIAQEIDSQLGSELLDSWIEDRKQEYFNI